MLCGTMAEVTKAFHLEVDGWDLEESDAAPESNAVPEDVAPESGPAKRHSVVLSEAEGLGLH